ncbi:hypothetical protein CGLO_08766 [Colletotrichum gloeosporioides Cg-14]|uniref:Azaphilone pigments biosynthesis cluster protein L N-terminal domain-containing protein n=1 Tax=Colletotrichum gloeosporioides (strain Cg-14) TaxID=1237896 RepID=T0KHN1_COLGC|nr:hypothetical protein CGLO_08766 [Colletotrichum gloeosporioides Cg-14]
MDPLSVAASVVGLLAVGCKLSSALFVVVSSTRDAPKSAQSLLREINDISAALGSLQSFVTGRVRASAERGGLILLQHVLTTLTGCVTTYSDLQYIVDGLRIDDHMGLVDRAKWMMQESSISVLVQRLQNHKASLTLMLGILQCQTMQEAENSTRELCALVQQVLESNKDLCDRIHALEREGSVIAESGAGKDDASTIRRRRGSKALSFMGSDRAVLKFAFDQDLETSRVYNRALKKRQSMASFTSTALYTTALSVFSNLSLSQVSNISFYALPIYAVDLSNNTCYVFGEEGAVQNMYTEEAAISTKPRNDSSSTMALEQFRQRPTRTNVANPTGLLGRFARRRRPPQIAKPENPVHVTHVGYDSSKDQFTVGKTSPFAKHYLGNCRLTKRGV